MDEQSLAELLSRSRNRTDEGKRIIERLGFSQNLWNAKEDPASIYLACGGYSPHGPANSCVLDPPRTHSVLERLVNVPSLSAILTSMATAWEPDFAVATSTEMSRLVEKPRWEVRVGWLTYLSKRLGSLPPLPAPVRIEPVGELGWLLILSSEPMSASNPEHVSFTARIRELLDRAGLIEIPAPA